MNPENPPTNTLPTPLTRRGFIAASAAVLSASPLAFASTQATPAPGGAPPAALALAALFGAALTRIDSPSAGPVARYDSSSS